MISTIGTAGRDYSSISAWESARGGILSELETGVCYDDSVFDESVTISGNTTSSSNYMFLTVDVSSRGDRGGYGDSGVRIERTSASSTVITINDDYCQVGWMKVRAMANGITCYSLLGGVNAKLFNSIAYANSGTGSRGILVNYGAGKPLQCCLVHAVQSGGSPTMSVGIEGNNAAAIGNCTVYGDGISLGFLSNIGADPYVYNCISLGCDSSDWSGSFNALSDYNSSGGGWAHSISVGGGDFIVAGTNFRILKTAAAYNAGTNLSVYYTTDFEDKAFNVWSLGVDRGPNLLGYYPSYIRASNRFMPLIVR